MVNWQVAPADWEIANYDEPKVRYRREVENFLEPLKLKSLRRKTFVTISCNVLCADIASSRETVEPIDRDLYLPLEIALTKWSTADHGLQHKDRQTNTTVWMINPGPHITGSYKYSMDQMERHKIDFKNIRQNDICFREDFAEIAKEINSMLTPDRTVFSTQLRNCRQDLGCLKWLNRAAQYKMKPVKVYSLEDLYVVLIRRLLPDDLPKEDVSQGIARHRMEFTTNTYDSKFKCDYHKNSVKTSDDNDTRHCARALAECYSNVLLDDIDIYISSNSRDDSKESSTETPSPIAGDRSTTGG